MWRSEPRLVLSETTRDALKIIACCCMVTDHIHQVFLMAPGFTAWLMGRLAFPLFCLVFCLHLRPGRRADVDGSQSFHFSRMLAYAFYSQVVYLLAFHGRGNYPWWGWNVLGLFALVQWCLMSRFTSWEVARRIVVGFVALVALTPSSYGVPGLLVVGGLVALLWSRDERIAAFGVLAALVGLAGCLKGVAPALVVSVALCVVVASTAMLFGSCNRRVVRSGIFLNFYPAHLAVLAIARLVVL